MREFTEVMRQQGDPLFIDILNAAQIGEIYVKDVEVSNCQKGDIESALTEATVIFSENSPKNSYNRSKLDSLSEVDIEIYATDEVPQGTPATLIENLHTKNQGRTGGLKKGAGACPTKYKDVYVAFEGKN